MSYIQKHKYHLTIFGILLLIAGVSWRFSFIKTLKLENIKTTTTTAFAATPLVTNSKIQDTNKTQDTNPNNQTATNTLPDFAKATPGKQVISYKLQVTTTSTALEAMKNAKLDFKTKTFSGLGEFVEEIGGLKNDPQGGKYWIYFINGESAKLGISTQIVKPGDLIEWNYGNANFTN